MRRPFRQSIYPVLLFVTVAMPGRLQAQPPQEDSIERWVALLGSDSYASRKRSEIRLFQLATADNEQFLRLKSLLRTQEKPPTDLELHLAKRRLLDLIETHQRQVEMDRFLYDPTFDHHAVDGWDPFRRHAGDGLDARLVFAAAAKEQPGWAHQFDRLAGNRIALPDLDQIARQDTAAWSLVLWTECEKAAKVADRDTMRLTATLRCMGTGPSPRHEHEQRVLSRLIHRYLRLAPIDLRDRIVIGLRYQCNEVIESGCRRVLNDPTESPSRIVTALLAASVLNFSPQEIDGWIEDFREDSRVSHVWRSMLPPKTTHRTQVRDVALALEFHRAGIDPRTRGFAALVADPILVFRPYSLGFETDQSRGFAHANGPRKSPTVLVDH
jgi:hypothetical protein